MDTETSILSIGGLDAEVVRKPIKNLHIGVYPPDGRLRVAAPVELAESAVRAAVVRRLSWIRRHRKTFRDQARETKREFTSGETHWYLGRRYRLRFVDHAGRTGVHFAPGRRIELRCRPDATVIQRGAVMDRWYRRALKQRLPLLVAKWSAVLDVEVADVRVRRMKTKWGSANQRSHRISINLELAKKPERALDYVVLHELAHLVERNHGERFHALLDRGMPHWRFIKAELGSLPLGHSTWAG
jgi:predicted metal-dependent hydrolase